MHPLSCAICLCALAAAISCNLAAHPHCEHVETADCSSCALKMAGLLRLRSVTHRCAGLEGGRNTVRHDATDISNSVFAFGAVTPSSPTPIARARCHVRPESAPRQVPTAPHIRAACKANPKRGEHHLCHLHEAPVATHSARPTYLAITCTTAPPRTRPSVIARSASRRLAIYRRGGEAQLRSNNEQRAPDAGRTFAGALLV
jgi:hypothetical protein